MKTRVIVNPNSANGRTGRQWMKREPLLFSKLGTTDVVFTTGPGEATALTRKALLEGFERIIAVGGDGTVNEVVNGFFDENGVSYSESQLALLIMGTGGDLSKSLGISTNFEESLNIVLRGRVKPIDLGRISCLGHDGQERVRYFVNIASFGMGGEVDIRMNQAKYSKLLGGKAAYYWATLRTLIGFKNKQVRIIVDNHFDETLRIKNVAVANGQYFGGGMWIAPRALMDDGLFDLIILGDIGPVPLIVHTKKFYNGTHLELPGVLNLRGRRIEARIPGSVLGQAQDQCLLDVDGDPFGCLPAAFEILPGVLDLVC